MAPAEGMAELSLGYSAGGGETFRRQIAADSVPSKQLIDQLNLKN